MQYLGVFLAGLVVGAVIVFVITRLHRREVERTFSALSLQALSRNSEDFLKLANETLSKQAVAGTAELESKKKLIDQTLDGIKVNIEKVQTVVTGFEKDRATKFGEISTQLKTTADQTEKLHRTTARLETALASTRIRGQWGERMAEDVLRLAGFVEGINYQKQKTQESIGSRPDYTFLLPQALKVNMDVKFPLDNYLKYVNENEESVKQGYKDQFLKDAKQRIKEVTGRGYINPSDNTVDYVLVFIPNEQVYCFINENDCTFMDEALKNKVVLCSPITLYSILAVMRQAVDNFALEKTASEMLSLFGAFQKQWNEYKNSMDKMGKAIDSAKEEFGRLASTRTNALERPLRKIEDLRRQRGILESPLADDPPEITDGKG